MFFTHAVKIPHQNTRDMKKTPGFPRGSFITA